MINPVAAGTAFFERADAEGFTYAKMCRPCPDGYYCPAGRTGFSPVATPCPAGSRGTVFGQKVSTSCVSCAIGYYQDTPGSMVCATCVSATTVASASCDTVCRDGFFSVRGAAVGMATRGRFTQGQASCCLVAESWTRL